MQIFNRNGNFLRKIAIRYIDIVAGLAITPEGEFPNVVYFVTNIRIIYYKPFSYNFLSATYDKKKDYGISKLF